MNMCIYIYIYKILFYSILTFQNHFLKEKKNSMPHGEMWTPKLVVIGLDTRTPCIRLFYSLRGLLDHS